MLRKSIGLVIALDVGGSSVKSALVAPGGRIAAGPHIAPLDSAGDAASILTALAAIIDGYEDRLPGIAPARRRSVALGFPGPFDYAAGVCLIEDVGKFGALYGINLRQALQAGLRPGSRAILFRNDAEAAIVGEACYGAGRPYRRLIGITLGTGCGSAFVVDGLPVTTGPGVPPQGWLYPMRFRGRRADDVFSRRGIEARLRAASASAAGVKQAAQAARAGDQVARQVFEALGADLGEFLNPFAAAFRAEAVLLLGQIAGALDLFGPALRRALALPALLGERGADAALLGAADLLFKQCQ